MFCIEIAGIPIGIENQYPGVQRLCGEYIVEAEHPAFTVRVSDEEISEEQGGDESFSRSYCESLCLYRKICCHLARYDAFLMHAAVVAVDERAYVFAAPSGVGKTTHLRLWLEQFGGRAQVINGDKPVFRFLDGVLYACGTPWNGKEGLGSNIMRPVQAVCFLEQGETNRIRLLEKQEISRRIFSQVLIPKEEEEFDCFWRLLEKFTSSARFYLMYCNRESDAARLAYDTMRRS